jgi:hypothetical protein
MGATRHGKRVHGDLQADGMVRRRVLGEFDALGALTGQQFAGGVRQWHEVSNNAALVVE